MHPWPKKVWLNPPYGTTGGKSNQAIWSQRLITQYEQDITTEAILLVNAAMSDGWFQPLYRYPMCFPDGRVRFIPAGRRAESPTHSTALVYFGRRPERFIEVFGREIGTVVARVSAPREALVIRPELF